MNTRTVDLLSKVFIFAAGVAVGAAVTWKYLSEEKEEVEEVVDDEEEFTGVDSDADMPEEEYRDALKKGKNMITEKMNYTGFSKKGEKNEDEKGDDENMEKPYVISPEEFGDMDYKIKSLVLYADGVVVNEYGAPVNNVDEMVGEESLSHFGEYEEDSVFVRNEAMKTDFEILRDNQNYNDTMED